jgi:sulfur relay (sulfurtransferase) DsrF/TusC family protein
MSIGLTLARNEVTVVLVEDGVYLLASSDGEAAGYADVKRHLKTLKELHCEVVAEREALEQRDVSSDNAAVAVKGHREIAHMMEQSDRVIAF